MPLCIVHVGTIECATKSQETFSVCEVMLADGAGVASGCSFLMLLILELKASCWMFWTTISLACQSLSMDGSPQGYVVCYISGL